MRTFLHRAGTICVLALSAAALLAVAVPAAHAQTYSDVRSGHWARPQIDWVTDFGPLGNKLLDDYASSFKPEQAITRAQLARALVVASGHQDDGVDPILIPDVVRDLHPYYWDIQRAVRLGYMNVSTRDGTFHPDDAVTAAKAEAAVIRWLQERYSGYDWSLLSALRSGRWAPTDGWQPKVPSYLPAVVASRQLRLRFNHPDTGDGHEVRPGDPIDRAEMAYIFWRSLKKIGSEYGLYGLSAFNSISLPTLSPRQKEIAGYALKYVGYPYIWGGEWPTKASPYGYQKAGGFDCSGFTFYVMQLHFGYPVDGRGASDQAVLAKPRIARDKLKCGDLIFFGYDGPSSTRGQIYHAALYLGRGWFIHSTGSSDGVTLASLNSSDYWRTYFAWGRRLLSPAQLTVP